MKHTHAVFLFTTDGYKNHDDSYGIRIKFTDNLLFENLEDAEEHTKKNPQSIIVDLTTILSED